MVAWHSPKGKEDFAFTKICVPTPPNALVEPVAINPTAARASFMSYDMETQDFKLVIHCARFNGTKRIKGATVGGSPGEGQVYKLGKGWVEPGERATSQWQLRRLYPGKPTWACFS